MEMTHGASLALYFALVFGIIVLPGMDMAFVLASTLRGGLRAGASATAGIMAGGLMHVAMGALGLAVLLQAIPAAFNAVLLAGALYVAWIGWSLLRAANGFGSLKIEGGVLAKAAFRQGVTTSLLNPKAYIFMLAVFPQFIRPSFGPVWLQALELSVITAISQAAVYGGVAVIAERARDFLQGDARAQAWLARGVGLLLLGAACYTGWQGWRMA